MSEQVLRVLLVVLIDPLPSLKPDTPDRIRKSAGMPSADASPRHAVCQVLRIVSFTLTQLPGPNYHCRGGEPTAVREMPDRWWGHFVVDIRRQVSPPGPELCVR